MPPTGGVGIDWPMMLLTNNNSIKEVIILPQMKSMAGEGQRMNSERKRE
jgi:lysyl-tRNA synthetase class II